MVIYIFGFFVSYVLELITPSIPPLAFIHEFGHLIGCGGRGEIIGNMTLVYHDNIFSSFGSIAIWSVICFLLSWKLPLKWTGLPTGYYLGVFMQVIFFDGGQFVYDMRFYTFPLFHICAIITMLAIITIVVRRIINGPCEGEPIRKIKE